MPNASGSPGRPALDSSHLYWLSFAGPRSLRSEHLRRAIRLGRIGGLILASPAFEQALSRGEFDHRIRELTLMGQPAPAIFESLIVESVRQAGDLLSAFHANSTGQQGHVSAAISPDLCYDTEGLVEEAEHLWAVVRRSNLMIRVPATHEALAAAGRLFLGGISIHLTHVSGVNRSREIAEVCGAALAARNASGLPVSGISCAVTLEPGAEPARMSDAGGPSFVALAAKGALPQKLLRPAYRSLLPADEDLLNCPGELLVETAAAPPPVTKPDEGQSTEDPGVDALQSESIKHEILCCDRALATIAAKRSNALRRGRTHPGPVASR